MAVKFWFVASTILCHQVAAFSLYPTLDADKLASIFGISYGCLNALNSTINCNDDLYAWVESVDSYWWEADNLTALCTVDCVGSSAQWHYDVDLNCSNDTLAVGGKLIPAESVAKRYDEGLNIACLQSTEDLGYCVIEAQQWQGSNVIQPDCAADPSDETCTDPTYDNPDYERLANLYSNDTLCSSCFVNMLQSRLLSDYLPDNDYSDYLIDQYQDILDVCEIYLPDLVVRALPTYAAAPLPVLNSTANANCSGQMIASSSSALTCDALSQKYNVATGDLMAAAGTSDCTFSGSICVEAPCTLRQVVGSPTCDALTTTIAATAGNLTVTEYQMLSWNRHIVGLCDNLVEGQYVCASAPGGSYVPLPAASNDTSASGQSRGGQGSPGLIITNPATPPSPLQSGVAATCTSYAEALAGDTCILFASTYNIQPAQLYQWNPVLGAGGSNCDTLFEANTFYCIAVLGSGTTSSTSTPTMTVPTSTSSAIPSPVQSGIAPDCTAYKEAVSGDACSNFASINNITPAQLYQWNPVLGTDGINCNTLFEANVYYCVGVSSMATTVPSPVQSGIASSCSAYKEAVAGDTCSNFASANNITPAQLYQWNSVLGAGGSNCNTFFEANVYYCVAVAGSK